MNLCDSASVIRTWVMTETTRCLWLRRHLKCAESNCFSLELKGTSFLGRLRIAPTRRINEGITCDLGSPQNPPGGAGGCGWGEGCLCYTLLQLVQPGSRSVCHIQHLWCHEPFSTCCLSFSKCFVAIISSTVLKKGPP